MQIYQKQKTFALFFSELLKCGLDIEYNVEKDGPHRICISEITDSKNMVRFMSEKCRFQGTFNKQHGKGGKILSKFARHHLYHI